MMMPPLLRLQHCAAHLVPDRWYFGRRVAVSDRSFIPKYDLKKRAYIGSTSMDPELSHIMCNHAKVHSSAAALRCPQSLVLCFGE